MRSPRGRTSGFGLILISCIMAMLTETHPAQASFGQLGPGAALVGLYSQGRPTETGGWSTLGMSGSFGGGALITYSLGPSAVLEAGLLYAPRAMTYNGAILKQRYAQVPLLLKVSPMPNFFLGVGASYDFKFRSPVYADVDDDTYSTIFVNMLSAVGSAGLRIEIKPAIALIVDGRYCIGLTDHDTDAAITRKLGQLQVLAGVGFQL